MKKTILFIICLIILSPIMVYATSYKVYDMTINLDENDWIVFTKDNIHSDEKRQVLNDLGLDYGYMVQIMTDQNLEVDAFLKYPDENNYYTEFTIVVQSGFDYLKNFHTYSDSKLKRASEEDKSVDYELLKINNYKFLAMDVHQNDLYGYAAFTVINGKHYTISVKKKVELNNQDKDLLNNIMKSVSFELDNKYEINNDSDSLLSRAFDRAIVGALVALVFGLPTVLTGLFKKKNNCNEEENNSTQKKEIPEKNANNKKYRCSKCGFIVDYEFDVCPNCNFNFSKDGSDEKQDTNDNSLSCDNCGASISKDADKCPKCGSTFVESEEVEEEKFVCDNCGSLVNMSAKKCPSCGESFDEEENEKSDIVETEYNIDQKYSDLNKLKELLDNDIITKEEFAKEKKKILNKR